VPARRSFVPLDAVTDALNAEDSIPPGASSEGTGQFFIGYIDIRGNIVAVGGERIAGGVWDQCKTDCTDGVASLWVLDEVTWADFQKAVAPGVVQVFKTSSTYLGDFGGLAGGDAICQERAEEVGLNGTWRAWLSDDTTDARDRIPDGRYELVNGTVIADDKDDLTDGELKAPIILNEFGELGQPDGGWVWTGTRFNGTGTEENCRNWMISLEGAGADYGSRYEMSSYWTKHDAPTSCMQELTLYCFGGGQ